MIENYKEEIDELPERFYDNPWLPCSDSLSRFNSLMLTPNDAERVLINAVNRGRKLSYSEKRALEEIMEDDWEGERNFMAVLKRIRREDGDDGY